MTEYIIDVDAGRDYEPPPRVYPKHAFTLAGTYLGIVIPHEEYHGFKIGDRVGYVGSDRPSATIAMFFESSTHGLCALYEQGGFDALKNIRVFK